MSRSFDYFIISLENCPHCEKTERLLKEYNLNYLERVLKRENKDTLKPLVLEVLNRFNVDGLKEASSQTFPIILRVMRESTGVSLKNLGDSQKFQEYLNRNYPYKNKTVTIPQQPSKYYVYETPVKLGKKPLPIQIPHKQTETPLDILGQKFKYEPLSPEPFPKNRFRGKNVNNTFKWDKNSCFFDSTIFLLLSTLSHSDFFWKRVLYSSLSFKKGNVCFKNQALDNALVQEVQSRLKRAADYLYGNRETPQTCDMLRNLFIKCEKMSDNVESLAELSSGKFGDTMVVLEAIDKMFDLTNLIWNYFYSDIPKIERRTEGYSVNVAVKVSDKIVISSQNLIEEQIFKRKNFEKYIVDAEFLTITVNRRMPINDKFIYNKNYKIIPNEYIVLPSIERRENELQLVGIIIWKNSHYTVFFLNGDRVWFHYDDQKASSGFKRIGTFDDLLKNEEYDVSIYGREYWYMNI